jgi:sugar/nucleoside kinase (ribokinase family)
MSVLCSGSYVADITVPGLKQIGPPGSLTYAPMGIHLTPGGHSANVSIDLTKLGRNNVHSVGCIGNDFIGKFLVEMMEKQGVHVHFELNRKSTTAKNIALIVEGEDKRFIAELTANALLTPEHLLKNLKTIKPKILYLGTLGGLSFVDPIVSKIVEESHKIGVLNLVDPIMPTDDWSYLFKAFHSIDVFHCNREEAESLTGIEDLVEAVGFLIDKGVKLVLLSDGPRGVVAKTSSKLIQMPAFRVKEIDPTGAGDAFCAGVIDGLMSRGIMQIKDINQDELIEVLLEGQAAGASCVTGIGSTTTLSKEAQIHLIKKQGKRIVKNTKES